MHSKRSKNQLMKRNVKRETPQAPPLGEPGLLDMWMHNQANAAMLLLGAAVLAFVCANATFQVAPGLSLADWYHNLWHMDLGIAIQHKSITQSLHVWINDGLMVIFFFLAGLEIKRELLVGELASLRRAALPIAGAIGGMVAPAATFALFNIGGPGIGGWGIPMATDIAFAVGVLGLLSGRVPAVLSTFLMALAIVDDLGAVLVIAIFYTETISTNLLMTGMLLLGASYLLGFMGVRNSLIYAFLFALVWAAFLQSGVHATVAGVLFAFSIPANAVYESTLFKRRLNELVHRFDEAEDFANSLQVNEEQQDVIVSIQKECMHVEAPLQRILRQLHPMSAFLIMPLFALANAGVAVNFSELPQLMTSRVTLGVMLGLLLGKQLGIMSAVWGTVKLGLAELPRGVRWMEMYAVSVLGSIGFTMSLFITELAFKPGSGHDAVAVHGAMHDVDGGLSAVLNAEAKLGVLSASLIAGILGVLILHRVMPPADPEQKGGH